jgi:FixJ family two-component response regulator
LFAGPTGQLDQAGTPGQTSLGTEFLILAGEACRAPEKAEWAGSSFTAKIMMPRQLDVNRSQGGNGQTAARRRPQNHPQSTSSILRLFSVYLQNLHPESRPHFANSSMNPECPVIHLLSDDRSRRWAIARLLEQTGAQIVAASGLEEFFVLNRIKQSQCVVLDLSAGGAEHFQLLAELIKADSARPVLCVSEQADLKTAVRAMKAGAFDFLLTSEDPARLCQAVGEAVAFHHKTRQLDIKRTEFQARYEHLTAREKQIFALIITGQPNKQIAASLGLAVQTVKIHRSRVLAKMGTASAIELLQAAQALGNCCFLPPDQPPEGPGNR